MSGAWRVVAARLVSAMLAAWLVVAPVSAQPVSPEEKQKLIDRAAQLVRDRAFATGVDFDRTWSEALEKNRAALEQASDQAAFARVMNRIFREFGVSHINLVTPRVAEQRSQASMVGIGIRHSGSDDLTDGLRIDEIIEGGPAQRAGLEAGDVILRVDGEPIRETSVLRGEEGTEVRLLVRRGGGEHAGKEEEIVIRRGTFSTVEPARLTRLGDDAAVLRLPTFATGYNRQTVERLFRELQGVRYLVLDLRSNGGGAVVNLNHFLSMFFPANTEIGTNISRTVAQRFQEATDRKADNPVEIAEWTQNKFRVRRNVLRDADGQPILFDGRIAVLINRGSASASEIATAALSELKNAITVGTQTAGAVLVSTPVRMEGGFQMTVPISDYVTIKGRRLEGNPLRADIQFDRRITREAMQDPAKDPVVQRALEALRSAEARQDAKDAKDGAERKAPDAD
jgi:carboxyl-terminal processing protease